MAKLILGVALGAIVAIAFGKLAATRSRNGALTPIRYSAPFLDSGHVLVAAQAAGSNGTMNYLSVPAVQRPPA